MKILNKYTYLFLGILVVSAIVIINLIPNLETEEFDQEVIDNIIEGVTTTTIPSSNDNLNENLESELFDELVLTEEQIEPISIAKILSKICEQESPGLVISGKQAIDGDNNQTGQMLAALTDMPQGTFASKIEIDSDKVKVTREIDGGLQTVSLNMPAIITTDLRLNEPRYASLPNIMKAKKKPIDQKSPEDYGIDVTPRVNVLKVVEPPKREAGIKVENISELVEKLKNEAGVI